MLKGMKLSRRFMAPALVLTAATFLAADPARAGEPTAFDLIKEGNRYVGEQSKDKVVQIRSEKSVGTLTPNLWYVVFYDPDATFKATEVKFGAGNKLNVTRPMRVIEMGTGDNKKLDRDKLKVDSDKAIKIAAAEPLLKSLTLKATKLILQRGDEGPVWKVTLWAAIFKTPTANADIGSVWIAADSGKVLRTDLHINSLD
jgi:hypothetical protein